MNFEQAVLLGEINAKTDAAYCIAIASLIISLLAIYIVIWGYLHARTPP